LDHRWTAAQVGGVDRIPGFISLFRGNNLHVAALVDVQSGHKQKIENARKTLSPGHLLTADTYASQGEADIEDVLGREFYLELVSSAYALRPSERPPVTKPADAPERVVAEIARHFSGLPIRVPQFDHFTPAEFLYHDEVDATSFGGFGKALENMGRLIRDLNALMDSKRSQKRGDSTTPPSTKASADEDAGMAQ
jgi:hypothetical protein